VKKEGKKALPYFARASDIEKHWRAQGDEPPVSYQSAREAWAQQYYQAKSELEQDWAMLCEQHEVDLERYEQGKRFLPKLREAGDDFPKVFIKGADLDKRFDNCAIVKLPKSDIHLLLLGEMTDCCFSVGRNAERCIDDLLNQSDKAVYVLLKRKRKTKAFIDDEGNINYGDCRIVGFTYTWLSVCRNICFDSVESLKSIDQDCSDRLFQQLAETLASKMDCARVTKGLKHKKGTVKATEMIASGVPYPDSHRQTELYPSGGDVFVDETLAPDRSQVEQVLTNATDISFRCSYQNFLSKLPKTLKDKPIYGLVQCYLSLTDQANEKQCLAFLKHMARLDELDLVEAEKVSVLAIMPRYMTLEQVMSLNIKSLTYLSTAIAGIIFHSPTWTVPAIDMASLSNRLLRKVRLKLAIAGTDEIRRYLQYALGFIVYHHSCKEPSLTEADYLHRLNQALPVFAQSMRSCSWMANKDKEVLDKLMTVIALLIIHYTPTNTIEDILRIGFSLTAHQLGKLEWMMIYEVNWVSAVDASGKQLFPLQWMVKNPLVFDLLGSKDNIHDGLRYFLTEAHTLTRNDLASAGDLLTLTYLLSEYRLFKQFKLDPRQYLALSHDERVNLLFPSKRALLESYIAATDRRYQLSHYAKLISAAGTELMSALSFDMMASLSEKQLDFLIKLSDSAELSPILAIRKHTPLKEYVDKLCECEETAEELLAKALAIEAQTKGANQQVVAGLTKETPVMEQDELVESAKLAKFY